MTSVTAMSQAQSSPSRGLYLFCVARAAKLEPEEAGLTPDSPLQTIVRHGLSAVVCEVPLADWTGAAGEANLQDLKWLTPRALRHESVIERVMAFGAVLPLRFGCLFSGEESLSSWLERHHAAIGEYLTAIADKQEWSLKGWLHAQRAAAALAATDNRIAELPVSPGARYLREQKLRQELVRSAREWGRESGQAVLDALLPLCANHRALGIRAGTNPGREEEAAFHYALLVAPAELLALHDKVAQLDSELRPRGLEVALSGPWPPFSFCPNLSDSADETPAEECSQVGKD